MLGLWTLQTAYKQHQHPQPFRRCHGHTDEIAACLHLHLHLHLCLYLYLGIVEVGGGDGDGDDICSVLVEIEIEHDGVWVRVPSKSRHYDGPISRSVSDPRATSVPSSTTLTLHAYHSMCALGCGRDFGYERAYDYTDSLS